MSGELLLVLVGVAAIATASGIVHSAIGFGFAIVALALLPFVMDARTAHLMLPICSLPMLVATAWAYRQGTDWPSLRPALIGIALLMPVGLYLFNTVSLDLLVRGTGLAILVMVLQSVRNRQMTIGDEAAGGSSFATGAICGFLGGAVNIAGPPVAAYALKQGWSPVRFKAFVTQCLLVVSIYKVLGLLVAGSLTREAILYAVWVTPFSVLGIGLGVMVSKYIAPQRFQYLVAIALIGVACMLMYRGSPAKEQPIPETSAHHLACGVNDLDAGLPWMRCANHGYRLESLRDQFFDLCRTARLAPVADSLLSTSPPSAVFRPAVSAQPARLPAPESDSRLKASGIGRHGRRLLQWGA